MLIMGALEVKEDFSRRLKMAAAKRKLRKKNDGSLGGAIEAAAAYARETRETYYVYGGNSYGHGVWQVVRKQAQALCGINNSSRIVYTVTPELDISRAECAYAPRKEV